MSNYFESALAQAEATTQVTTHWGYVNQHAAGITVARIGDNYESWLNTRAQTRVVDGRVVSGESTIVNFTAPGGDDVLANLIFATGSQDEDQLFFDRGNVFRAGLMYDLLVRRVTPLLASSNAYFISPNSGVIFIIVRNGVKYAYRQTFRMHAKGVIEKNGYLTLDDTIDMKSAAKPVKRLADTPCPCNACEEKRTLGRVLTHEERTHRAKQLESSKPSATRM